MNWNQGVQPVSSVAQSRLSQTRHDPPSPLVIKRHREGSLPLVFGVLSASFDSLGFEILPLLIAIALGSSAGFALSADYAEGLGGVAPWR